MSIKQGAIGFLGRKRYNKLRFSFSDAKEKRNNREIFSLRENNRKYKDIYKGRRCFVLGNGPSLKDVELASLSNEVVFSVNNFSQVAGFQAAKPDVHLWMDLSFFQMREDQKYDEDALLENYRKMAKLNPICFVPYECSKYIKDKKLDEILNINYLQPLASLEDEWVYDDITKPISCYTTVVQYAILVALYMGVEEIYLLGCDSTNIVSVLNCAQSISNDNMHAYDNDDVDERYKKLIDEWGMAKIFYDQYLLFQGYDRLLQYCNSKGKKLVNCSTRTIISGIPRRPLSEILEEEKE